jgi:hypothetical protein
MSSDVSWLDLTTSVEADIDPKCTEDPYPLVSPGLTSDETTGDSSEIGLVVICDRCRQKLRSGELRRHGQVHCESA